LYKKISTISRYPDVSR